MERKDGQYYYAPRGRMWGIWKWHGDDSGGNGVFVMNCLTKEEARERVYDLNGWPRKPHKTYNT